MKTKKTNTKPTQIVVLEEDATTVCNWLIERRIIFDLSRFIAIHNAYLLNTYIETAEAENEFVGFYRNLFLHK